MGDIADYLLAQAGSPYEEGMERGDEPGSSHYIRQPSIITCRYCKTPGFEWVKTKENKWRLADDHGRIHSCSAYRAVMPVTREMVRACKYNPVPKTGETSWQRRRAWRNAGNDKSRSSKPSPVATPSFQTTIGSLLSDDWSRS